MDTRFFVSREEFHNVQMDVRQLQAVQTSQTERLLRLEKRQQDDVAIRSAWSTSPFPSALVGTPQHGPIRVPSTEAFDLDEHSQTLGSLHLEPDDEPIRRAAAASRANSVRFDESANLAQSARHFSEIGPFRPGSSLMMERSLSHKSDGRHSSTGHSVHSVHSVASGRASSLALDTNFSAGGHEPDSPMEIPEPPPVFFVLGSVPAIIRCWLTKDFANNTLLYAAVCSGAQRSTVEFSLVKELGLSDLIFREDDSPYRIQLRTYLAEAIPATKSADPVPQIPSMDISFDVVGVDQAIGDDSGKNRIRVIIGSDALRSHSADILFSRNLMSLYSSERDKLAVPFVRPEDDALFKHLCTTSIVPDKPRLNASAAEFVSSEVKSHDSVGAGDEEMQHERLYHTDSEPLELSPEDAHDKQAREDEDEEQSRRGRIRQKREPTRPDRMDQPSPQSSSHHGAMPAPTNGTGASNGANAEPVSPTFSQPIPAAKWPGAAISNHSEMEGDSDRQPRNSTSSDHSGKDAGSTSDGGRRDASAIWGSWRQGGSGVGSDGGHRETAPLSGYQPAGRPRAMKVLKAKTNAGVSSARTRSSYEPAQPPRSSGEHRRKSQGVAGNPSAAGSEAINGNGSGSGGGAGSTPSNVIRWESKRSISSNNAAAAAAAAAANNGGSSKETKGGHQQGLAALELRNNTSSAPRSSNPVGGASAFAWMKSAKPKTSTTAAE